jgi:hypothetical protein
LIFYFINSNFNADDKEAMKTLREEALSQIALKEKQRKEASSSLLNSNKRESVREQMKVSLFLLIRKKRISSDL